jgi:hypothetical protein
MIRKLLVKPPVTTSEIQTIAATVEVYSARINTAEARPLRHDTMQAGTKHPSHNS